MTAGNDASPMSTDTVIPDLARSLAVLVRQAMADLRPRLIDAALSGQRGESENPRHEDNFLSEYDLWMHGRYKELIGQQIPSFIYASEEADPEVIGSDPDPDLVILADPLDTSELAVRGLCGYTHLLAYSRRRARPIAAIIGDIFHHIQLYIAAMDDDGADRAYLITSDSPTAVLRPRRHRALSQALVTNYLMRPRERFLPLAQQTRFLEALSAPSDDGKARGRIGVDFGSIGLCHVAAGFSDAMIETAKGFAIWDLSPGHYMLHAAGGVVIDLNGTPIPLNYGLGSLAEIRTAMDKRQKFIAAADLPLAREILATLNP
jgi:myo-inositol-1(or 4)-monophosphatase